jgi:hypothetical protein
LPNGCACEAQRSQRDGGFVEVAAMTGTPLARLGRPVTRRGRLIARLRGAIKGRGREKFGMPLTVVLNRTMSAD